MDTEPKSFQTWKNDLFVSDSSHASLSEPELKRKYAQYLVQVLPENKKPELKERLSSKKFVANSLFYDEQEVIKWDKIAFAQIQVIVLFLISIIFLGIRFAEGMTSMPMYYIHLVIAILLVASYVRLAYLLVGALAAVGFFVLLLVPLVNIIVILVLINYATNCLRSNGYKVGLFGAKRL